MAFNDFLRNTVLNNIFGATPFTSSPTLYLGLSTASIADDGTGAAEPTGGSYERITVANDKVSWSTATGANNKIDNLVELIFPEATGGWGTVTHFFLSDAASGGNILISGTLGASKVVEVGDVARFPVGSIVIAIDEA